VTAHFSASADLSVALPPDAAMTLFTPEGERSWAGSDGWDPHYPVPTRTAGVGAVFTTRHGTRTTIWVMIDHSQHGVRYVRVTPDGLAGTVEVRTLSGSGTETRLRVTYDLTALTDDVVDELARFAAGYDAEIAAWASTIADSLAGQGAAAADSADRENRVPR
jgi:hypothetical protein